MAAPLTQRRSAKSAETRRAEILDAAVRLFDQAGYDATTVQHIAREAGVAAGTVYLYFSSKEHVLLSLHADFHAGIEAAMQVTFETVRERVDAGNVSNAAALELMVGAMVDTVVRFIRDNPATSSVICRFSPRLPETREDDNHTSDYLAAALELGLAEGKIEVSDPQMAARLLEAALSGPLSHMVVEGDAEQVDRLAAQAKEFFVKALAPRA